MLKTRIIPVLLLENEGLYKTVNFKEPRYIGDPINCVRLFNEKEVDELIFLDISATKEKRGPHLHIIKDIATECFMPFAYGGGVRDINTAEKIFAYGAEKIILNSVLYEENTLIEDIAKRFGTQSVVASIDAKKSFVGGYSLYSHNGMQKHSQNIKIFAKELENRGVGEIMVTSIDRDGKKCGYDTVLTRLIANQTEIPVIACGGCGSLDHIKDVILEGRASAVAAGSMFVFHGKHDAVLITYPCSRDLEKMGLS